MTTVAEREALPTSRETRQTLVVEGFDGQVLGPLPCVRCRTQVIWVRLRARWCLMQGGEPHRCPQEKVA